MIIQQKLTLGDKIAIISPASAITEDQYNTCIKNIESLGFIPKPMKNILKNNGFIAGTDAERAEDLNKAFIDNDIKGIICARGGYGTSRILDLIDYKAIEQNPKPILGYSDITALLNTIYIKTGLITYHGPMATNFSNKYAVEVFKSVLIEKNAKTVIPISENHKISYKIIKKGEAKGNLIGGNLSVFCSLLGTKYSPDFTNSILFLEEIGEKPFRIDRMLTHIINTGKLNKLKGIILGQFKNCDIDYWNLKGNESITLSEVLSEKFSKLNIPVVSGFSFGHIDENCTLPIGGKTYFNTKNKEIMIL